MPGSAPPMSPLPFFSQRPACPIDTLPEPCRSAAIYAIAEKGVPAALALTDAIAAIAAVVHCGYDCEAPDGDRIPATINTCVVAPSRTGKGTSMKVFFRLFLDTETEAAADAPSGGRAALPVELTKFVARTITYVSLVESLAGYRKNLTIQREEGSSFLKTELFKNDADALTQLWSGSPPLDHRFKGKELVALHARCSVGFRIQPVFMEEYLRKYPLNYKLGFWPRAIAGCHDPERFPENSAYQLPRGVAGRPDRFQRRMEQIARRLARRTSSARYLVKLSLEAKAFMHQLQHVLRERDPEHYSDIDEAVGRAWENTLRIATVLHVFCVGRGPVGRDMMERAWVIVQWSLYQHQLIFVESLKAGPFDQATKPREVQPTPYPQRLPKRPRLPRPMEDANWVLDCLRKLVDGNSRIASPLDEIHGLSGLSPKAFKTALDWLVLEKRVHVFFYEGGHYMMLPDSVLLTRFSWAEQKK